MPNLPSAEIEELARAAKLQLSPEEKTALEKDLQALAAFAGTLDAVAPDGAHCAGVDGTAASGLSRPPAAALRADLVSASMECSALLAAAPDVRDGFICVPRVVE